MQTREAEIFTLQTKLREEPDRQAAVLARRHNLLSAIAKAQLRVELGHADAQHALSAAEDELAEVNAEVLVNGRRRQALEEMLNQAQTAEAQAEATKAQAERAIWEPRLRQALPQYQKEFLERATTLCAAVSLLEGIPAAYIGVDLQAKRLAFADAASSGVSFQSRVTAEAEKLKKTLATNNGSVVPPSTSKWGTS